MTGYRADMFKPVVGPDFIVAHRMGGNHAKRDPLLDEKMGDAKRSREDDRTNMVYYKESVVERKARIYDEKKRARKGEGITGAALQPAASTASGENAGPKNAKERKVENLKELGSFKDRLKGSSLPEAAANAEKKT